MTSTSLNLPEMGFKQNAYPQWLLLAAVLVATFVFYYPSLQNGFVNWDDTSYVTENKYIQSLSGENLKAIFTKEIAENYHPITFLSLAIDYAIAGDKPFLFHLTNLLLHLLNTLLVFQFVRLLVKKESVMVPLLVAALFALHPMHVESVAWVTGRKDLLFTLFYLAGLIGYIRYLDSSRWQPLAACFLCCVLSLLSKPSAISFFLALPLLDYWFGRSFSWKAVLEKLPFAAAAAIIAVVTINLQTDSSLRTLEQIPFLQRINITAYGIAAYMWKVILPLNLNPFHPFPDMGKVPVYYYYMPFLALAMVGGLAWFAWKRGWKAGLFGLGFFLVTLAPTLQLVSFGEAVIAERYTYLPYVGLFFLMADGLRRLIEKYPSQQQLALIATTAFVTILATVSFQQTKIWKDGTSLWTSAIDAGDYPTSKAYTNRGTAYAYQNKFELAIEDFNMAKQLNSNEFDAYHNTGIIYYRQNRLDEALEQLNHALQIIPLHANALGNRGHVYFKKNDYDNAVKDYTASINGDPYNAEVYNMRGFVLYDRKQQPQMGIEDFDQAIRLSPDYAAAYVNRSKAYIALNNPTKAKEDVVTAQKLGFVIDPAYIQEVEQKLTAPQNTQATN